MTDVQQTIIKYALIIVALILVLYIVVPFVVSFISFVLELLLKLAIYGAIAYVLFLLGRFLLESYKNNS